MQEGRISLEHRADLLKRAEPRICAFDIETTKLPLQFPNSEYDQVYRFQGDLRFWTCSQSDSSTDLNAGPVLWPATDIKRMILVMETSSVTNSLAILPQLPISLFFLPFSPIRINAPSHHVNQAVLYVTSMHRKNRFESNFFTSAGFHDFIHAG